MVIRRDAPPVLSAPECVGKKLPWLRPLNMSGEGHNNILVVVGFGCAYITKLVSVLAKVKDIIIPLAAQVYITVIFMYSVDLFE
jgi:hypothetical protein